MSGRDIAFRVITGMTVASVAGVAGAVLVRGRWPQFPGIAVLVMGVALTCGAWAAVGWTWWLAGAVIR